MLWWDGCRWRCYGSWWDHSSTRYGILPFRSFPQFLGGNSPYYNIELKEIHVAGKPLKLNPKIFDGRHGTVLDSGTTYAYLPGKAFAAFKGALMKETHVLKRIPGPDPHYDDICFSGSGRDVSELSKKFPQIDMVFGNGQKLSLSPENYLFRHMKVSGAYCLGIFQNADSTTLLGGIIVRNMLVTYDRGNDKVGFWKTNCSDLWRRLQFPSVPAPPLLVSSSNDTNMGISPTLAPDGSPLDVLPGAFRIGDITFDMSISLNNSHTKPDFTELSEFIARELDVDDTQVHLLNVSHKGNHYLVRWGIFPDESAHYISNTTALNIILRLREHHMQFPEKFGSYHLVKLNVEPQIKKTWWQRNLVAVVLGTVITLLLSLSIVVLWSVWRRRQEASKTYQPVSAVVPEQELQPLQS